MNHSNQNSGNPIIKNEGLVKTRLTQIMAIFFMLGGVQVATQYFAYRFQYQPQLGVHFNQLYPPWSILSGLVNGMPSIQISLGNPGVWAFYLQEPG